MEAILLQYAWVLVVLIVLEGLLAADNAVVMAVMVKHLPKDQQQKALLYGLFGAFIFRFVAIFLITVLVNFWQIQAVGAIYLLFMSSKHIYETLTNSGHADEAQSQKKTSGFWMTVLKVELADIAFAVDSILAAVAIAVTLPSLGNISIGGINAGPFVVMFLGGLIGVIMMRFAARWFVTLLEKFPSLETAAFLIVGWVGVKLAVLTLGHEKLGVIPHSFPHSTLWEVIFWTVLISIALIGFVVGIKNPSSAKKPAQIEID